jgi:hypothetical protein
MQHFTIKKKDRYQIVILSLANLNQILIWQIWNQLIHMIFHEKMAQNGQNSRKEIPKSLEFYDKFD